MKKTDLKRFGNIMAAMSENFRDDLSENGLAMRFEALKAYDIEQIQKAAIMLIRDRKYTKMPTVGEIVESIDGGIADKAEAQSMIVAAALSDYHYSDKFKDPITEAIISYRFGWWWIRHEMLSAQREEFFRSFKRLYRAMAKEVERKALGMPYSEALLEWINPVKAGKKKSIPLKNAFDEVLA